MVDIFINVANLTTVFSFVLAFICVLILNKFDRLLIPFIIYLIIGGSFDLITTAFALSKENNFVFIHLFTLLEFVMLSIFFSNIFKFLGSKFDTRKILFLVSIFVIFNSLFIQDIDSFNSISSTICSIVILTYCIYSFLLLIDHTSEGFYKFLKWIVMGLFIYHTVSLTILALGNVIVNITSDYKPIIWIIRAVIILFTKVLFGIVIWKIYLNRAQKSVNART